LQNNPDIKNMEIYIDPGAGFCFGVREAIQLAEEELQRTGHLYCLGQVVHNEEEENRLKALGLEVINYETYNKLKNVSVLIRAHGEAPETYRIAKENKLTLIDGTCPIVLKLQNRIKNSSRESLNTNGQLIIFGKKNHPEVIGLAGQAGEGMILVENESDIEKIDFNKPLSLYAQTTKSKKDFTNIVEKIEQQAKLLQSEKQLQFTVNDTICRHVSNRDEGLRMFAKTHEVIIFVGGEHSSNGRQLFEVCKIVNEKSWYVGNTSMLQPEWFAGVNSVGVSGATSTPQWLLEDVAAAIREFAD